LREDARQRILSGTMMPRSSFYHPYRPSPRDDAAR